MMQISEISVTSMNKSEVDEAIMTLLERFHAKAGASSLGAEACSGLKTGAIHFSQQFTSQAIFEVLDGASFPAHVQLVFMP